MHITEDSIRKVCSATIYNRAVEYFEKGRVHIKKRDDDIITALVDDDRRYNVRIDFGDDKVNDVFCTCAYFETMNSPCKHIAATLIQRMAELNNSTIKNENEQLCRRLCDSFNTVKNPPRLSVHFDIYINTVSSTLCTCSVLIRLSGREVQNTAGFLNAYSKNQFWDFRKKRSGKPPEYYVADEDKKILDILVEYYQNISNNNIISSPSFRLGSETFKRIIAHIEECGYTLFFNRINLGRLPFMHENPNILIDITATDDEINLYAGSYGTAIVPDGSIFYYENNLYITDKEWQKWFMPIYNSLCYDCRTQLSFSKQMAVDFARNVLPALSGRQGVITDGIETSVINTEPVFSMYFDSIDGSVTCVVKVSYGGISFTLPCDEDIHQKIIVRDKNAEDYVLWQLSDFEYSDGKFRLYDDELIFTFISKLLPELYEHAQIFLSSHFEQIIPKKHSITHHVSYNEKIDLLESSVESDLSPDEIKGILSAVKIKKSFYKLKNGEYIDIDSEYKDASIIDSLYDELPNDLNGMHINGYGLMYLLGFSGSPDIKLESSAVQFIDKVRNIREQIPDSLTGTLRGYQKDALHWMKQLSAIGIGGILADDMGLGKTLQVIAYIYCEKPENPTLIVCPSSLTYNWYNEISKFTPDAKALIIDGTVFSRKTLINKISEYDFIITSYAVMRRDYTEYENINFEYCVIDEAQNIKNAKSLNSRCVKGIKSRYKFALTGTPVENSLSELWSIFDFCASGYLNSYTSFRNEYETPIMNGSSTALEALRKKISPFILRRMKSQVLDELPEKIENTMLVNMTAEQEKLYQSFRNLAKERASYLLGTNENHSGTEILTLLLRLRQICCHPSVFDSAYKYGSGKLELLLEIVENALLNNHRILIFSQFTSMLEIIRNALSENEIECMYLDGSTPSNKRVELTESFNNGEGKVFLISLKAGGTGLNLTGADMVIHYDPWWNPAVMDQASDRAYRIGQKKAVQIIKLAAKNSIEEKILKLQEQKKAIADDVITENNNSFKNMSSADILALFE